MTAYLCCQICIMYIAVLWHRFCSKGPGVMNFSVDQTIIWTKHWRRRKNLIFICKFQLHLQKFIICKNIFLIFCWWGGGANLRFRNQPQLWLLAYLFVHGEIHNTPGPLHSQSNVIILNPVQARVNALCNARNIYVLHIYVLYINYVLYM